MPLLIILLRLNNAEANVKFFDKNKEYLQTLKVYETHRIKPSLMDELVEVVYETEDEIHIQFLKITF